MSGLYTLTILSGQIPVGNCTCEGLSCSMQTQECPTLGVPPKYPKGDYLSIKTHGFRVLQFWEKLIC